MYLLYLILEWLKVLWDMVPCGLVYRYWKGFKLSYLALEMEFLRSKDWANVWLSNFHYFLVVAPCPKIQVYEAKRLVASFMDTILLC